MHVRARVHCAAHCPHAVRVRVARPLIACLYSSSISLSSNISLTLPAASFYSNAIRSAVCSLLSLHVSVDSSASSRHLSGRERRSVAEERPPAADFTKKGTPKNTSALCAVVLVHVGHDVAAVDGHGDGK